MRSLKRLAPDRVSVVGCLLATLHSKEVRRWTVRAVWAVPPGESTAFTVQPLSVLILQTQGSSFPALTGRGREGQGASLISLLLLRFLPGSCRRCCSPSAGVLLPLPRAPVCLLVSQRRLCNLSHPGVEEMILGAVSKSHCVAKARSRLSVSILQLGY